jgi:hypothetical protein
LKKRKKKSGLLRKVSLHDIDIDKAESKGRQKGKSRCGAVIQICWCLENG